MAKNINVNLTFTASTEQAKKQLQSLQSQLNNLTSNALNITGASNFNKQLLAATNSAANLKAMLSSATDMETGQLNLAQFSQSLQASGKDLGYYRQQLSSLGPQGEKAFMQLARSISQAQAPLRATNTMIDKMWTTLSNTVRWQISAQAIQAVTGAISDAFSYAQDLNESLNNIRIVTGQTVEQMDKFAEKANQAAKALSTSTTEYTNAALIYYQQGLNDSEVEERTNATIKLANVTGESAETVSEWMTSIWNNFDNGSKSLEYYADVLTALGAATASSSDEIAGGLEKFAAIADTVGLSYEYASAALATITSQTRQSEDVVGTALKTIFARIQDLELGNTTEDGTTLGQYAETLNKIGVKVLDAQGNLRDMNLVLNDMGETWDNLSKAQQVATAQGVAGIRQYSQVIALMDNWDIFKQNVSIASSAEGALNEQADIYAESWEAANKRVKAAVQDLYDDLISDDFFIDLTDGAAKALDIFSEVIESMGGIKGLLPLLTTGLLNLFGPKLLTSIRNFSDQLQLTSRASLQLAQQTKQSALSEATALADQSSTSYSNQAMFTTMVNQGEIQEIGLNAQRELTQQEQTRLNMAIETLQVYEQQATALGKELDKHIEIEASLRQQIEDIKSSMSINDGAISADKFKQKILELIQAQKKLNSSTKASSKIKNNFAKKIGNINIQAEEMKEQLSDIGQLTFGDRFMYAAQGVSSLTFAFQSLYSAGTQIADMIKEGEFSFEGFLNVMMSLSMAVPMVMSGFSSLTKGFQAATAATTVNTVVTGANIVVKKGSAVSTDKEEKEHIENAAAIKFEKEELRKLNAEQLKSIGIQKINGNKFKTSDGTVVGGATKVGSLGAKGHQFPKDTFGTRLKGNIKDGWSGFKDNVSNSFKGVGQTIAKIGPSVGIAAVAIGAIVGGLLLMDNAINKHEKNLKKATNAAKAMKNQYDAVTQAVADFNNTLNSYKDATKSLDGLIKGTIEYKQALLEANTQALELINSSDTLKSMGSEAYNVVDGEIVIDDEALKLAQEEQIKNQENALISSQTANIQQQQAKAEADRIELLRDTQDNGNGDYNESSMWGVGGGVGAMATGALALGLTNIWNPVGWAALAAGALTAGGAAIYGATVGDVEENESAALEALEEQYGEQGGVTKEDLKAFFADPANSQFAGMEESFLENIDSINELIQSNEALRLQNEALEQQIADSIVQAKYGEEDDRIQGAIAEVVKQERSQLTDETNALHELIKGQDGLLQDLYGEVYKGGSLSEMTGTEILVTDAQGNTQKADQSTIAKQMASDIAFAVQSGDESIINDLKAKVDSAEGVSEGNKKAIKAAIEALQLSEETALKKIEEIRNQSAKLDKSTVFAGLENQQAHKDLMIQLAKDSVEDIDFSFLTREQIEELSKRQAEFDQDVQDKIEEGINTYEERRRVADAKTSISYDHEQAKADELATQSAKAGLNSSELIAYQNTIADTYNLSEKRAEEVVSANLKVKNGLTSVHKAFEDYGKSLDKSKKGTLEYSKGIAALKTSFEEWFGVEIDTEKIEENLETFKKAVNGDKDAIVELQAVAAEAMVLEMDLDPVDKAEVEKYLNELNNTDIKIGVSIDSEESGEALINKYNELIRTGAISNEEAIRQLEASGYNVATKKDKVYGERAAELAAANGDTWFEQEWAKKVGGKEIDIIDAANTVYDPLKNNLVDYMPEEVAEKEKENKKTIKSLDDELERYYEIKEAISDIEREVNRLSKAEERAFGNAKLKAMDKTTAELKKRLEAEKELANQMSTALVEDAASVGEYGFTIDASSGRITNYDEVIQDAINKAKEAVGTEQEEEAKEYLENAKKEVEQYTNTLNGLEDQQEKIIEYQYEIADRALQRIQTEVEIKVRVNDAELKSLEYLLKKLEDKEWGTAKRVDNLASQAVQHIENWEASYSGLKDTLLDIGLTEQEITELIEKGNTSVLEGKNITADQMEFIQSSMETMLDESSNIDEVYKQMWEEIDNIAQNAYDEFEKANAALERLTEIASNYKNIIDTLGKSNLGISKAVYRDLQQATVDIAQGKIAVAKSELDTNQRLLNRWKKEYSNAKTKDDKEKAQEQIDKYTEAVEKNTADLYGSIQEAAKAAQELRATAIDDSISNTLMKITGYSSMDDMNEAYERQKQLSELYLKDYEKVYKLTKLTRDVTKKMDETDSVKAKQALAKLQEKILKYQEAGVEMSEYELQYLQKEYDLELARIALEEAQNTKSQVKLRRDSEGNYGYVYTADEKDIAEKQQKYEDIMYEMAELTDEHITKMQEMSMQSLGRLMDTLKEIQLNTELTESEREAAIAQATAAFDKEQQYYNEQLTKGIANNNVLYQTNVSNSKNAEDAMFNNSSDFIRNYNDTFVGGLNDGLLGQSGSAKSAYEQLMLAVGTSLGEMTRAQQQFEVNVKSIFAEAGIDIENFGKSSNEALNGEGAGSAKNGLNEFLANLEDFLGNNAKGYKGKVEEMKNKIAELPGKTETELNKVLGKYANFKTTYDKRVNEINDITDSVATCMGEIVSAAQKISGIKDPTVNLKNSFGELEKAAIAAKKAIDDLHGTQETIGPKLAKDTQGNIISREVFGTTYYKGEDNNWYTGKSGSNVSGSIVAQNSTVGQQIYKSQLQIPWNQTLAEGFLYRNDKNGKVQAYESWCQYLPANVVGVSKELKNGKRLYLIHQANNYGMSAYIDQTTLNRALGNRDDYQIYKYYPGINKFDTGGYTGEWGPEGRLAMLHQKEIILNAHDTENFLTAIDMVRSMSDMLENNALAFERGLSNMLYVRNPGSQNSSLEQSVMIQAEFPNVSSKEEIEAAFNSLINEAAQYAKHK